MKKKTKTTAATVVLIQSFLQTRQEIYLRPFSGSVSTLLSVVGKLVCSEQNFCRSLLAYCTGCPYRAVRNINDYVADHVL